MLTADILYRKATLIRVEQCAEARDDFVKYCQLVDPVFYTEDKPHLTKLCQVLDDFYKGLLIRKDGKAYRKLMINIPPQHGKTRTLCHFCEWALGKDNEERIICASFGDEPAKDFSKYTRDGIAEEKNVEEQIVFSDIFPGTTIAHGTATYGKWALTGQHFNYKGCGIQGSITGKGASILLIDDPVKDREAAVNDLALNKIWNWYTGTFLSRVAAKAGLPLEILNMTRWASGDPCGRILDSDEKDEWYVLTMEAYDKKTDSMLCDSLLGIERYTELKKKMLPEIFNANYHQQPIDLEGTLYKKLKTYAGIPVDDSGVPLWEGIFNYTDTADEGDDYLCSITFATYESEGFILDVIYSLDGMEITEPLLANHLINNEVNKSYIESNNGGRGFARNVKRIMGEIADKFNDEKEKDDPELGSSVVVKWFFQSARKISRILTNSSFVMEHIYFPVNWQYRWPEFYQSMIKYQKAGKNLHDDAEDCITGVAEIVSKKKSIIFV